jgi:electron transfer flavoprotein alpha/beta subunit
MPLEEALRLKDSFGCTVAALSMGPPNAEATQRKALSDGVNDPVRTALLIIDKLLAKDLLTV